MNSNFKVRTVDVYPDLNPLERHVLFLESLAGKISTLRYQELLKAHFEIKNENKDEKKTPTHSKEASILNKITLINMEEESTTTTYQDAVDKVVQWWIDKSFFTPNNQNMGEKGPLNGLMNTVSLNIQAGISAEQVIVFESKLNELS